MRNLTKAARGFAFLIGLVAFGIAPAFADFEAGNKAYAKRDYDTAFKAWLPLAKAGNPAAQNNIGFMFRKGRGVPPDDDVAFSWYSRSAAQGFPDAMTNLGYMYDESRGTEQDLVESYKWFLLAHERGRVGAEGHLKILEDDYLTPEQVVEAKTRAAAWSPNPEIRAD